MSKEEKKYLIKGKYYIADNSDCDCTCGLCEVKEICKECGGVFPNIGSVFCGSGLVEAKPEFKDVFNGLIKNEV